MALRLLAAMFAAGLACVSAAAQQPNALREVAPGAYLLPNVFYDQAGPDGNAIILETPEGLVVVDTGRHASHSDAIVAFADARERPVVAIVNTHWHLDHSSGNRRITARFPEARLYTSAAVDRALAENGFLWRSQRSSRAQLEDESLSAAQRAEIEKSIATIDAGDSLRPDIVVGRSARLRIGGRRFDVRYAPNAVTDGDVWLYDRRASVAVVGDLVTLPAPFFETACPEGWRAALDHIWRTPFRLVIPGHGEPMTRAQFGTYRAAFGAFLDCTLSEAEANLCAEGWADGVAPLLVSERTLDREHAEAYGAYYVGLLRDGGGHSGDCLTR